MQDQSRLTRTLAGYLPAYIVPAAMGVAATPLLTRLLGPHEFGIFAVCLSFHGLLLTVAADPSTGALRRLYAPAEIDGTSARLLRALLGLAVTLAACVATVALALAAALVIAFDINGWFWPLVATVAMTASFTLFQYLLTTLYVQERVRATSGLQVGHSLLKAGGLVAGAVALQSAAGSLAGYTVILVGLVAWQWRGLRALREPLVDRVRWRTALGYGLPLIAVSVSFVVLAGFDRFALATLSGESSAGQYAVTYLLSDAVVSLPAMAVHYSVYPSMVSLWERGEVAQARALLRRAVDIFVVFAATFVGLLALAGDHLTLLFGGDGYHVPAAVPLLVGLGLLFYRLAYFETIAFELKLQTRGLAVTFASAALLCIPITAAAIGLWGLTGAAAGTTVSYALFSALVRIRNPLPEVTAYPLGRLARIAVIACAVVVAASRLPYAPSLVVAGIAVPLCAAAALGGLSALRERARRGSALGGRAS